MEAGERARPVGHAQSIACTPAKKTSLRRPRGTNCPIGVRLPVAEAPAPLAFFHPHLPATSDLTKPASSRQVTPLYPSTPPPLQLSARLRHGRRSAAGLCASCAFRLRQPVLRRALESLVDAPLGGAVLRGVRHARELATIAAAQLDMQGLRPQSHTIRALSQLTRPRESLAFSPYQLAHIPACNIFHNRKSSLLFL